MDEEWEFCALVPAAVRNGELSSGSQFGLGSDSEGLNAYKALFSTSGDDYRLLTLCIYEVSTLLGIRSKSIGV